MGDYRILVEAVGGHGCQREIGDGGTVYGCQRRDCPDCAARALVKELQTTGNNVKKAVIEHWPEDLGYATGPHPVDDLLTRKRSGSFSG